MTVWTLLMSNKINILRFHTLSTILYDMENVGNIVEVLLMAVRLTSMNVFVAFIPLPQYGIMGLLQFSQVSLRGHFSNNDGRLKPFIKPL